MWYLIIAILVFIACLVYFMQSEDSLELSVVEVFLSLILALIFPVSLIIGVCYIIAQMISRIITRKMGGDV